MAREIWDREAASFDLEADHGLTDPRTRAAWRDLLLDVPPAAPARVADLGCGTGTLTRLLTDEGYVVDGLDFAPEMISRARAKVPEATFTVGDAADPPLELDVHDVVLSRRVLWARPDLVAAFARWVDVLKPHGVIVLIEGRWDTGRRSDCARGGEDRARHPYRGGGSTSARCRLLGEGNPGRAASADQQACKVRRV